MQTNHADFGGSGRTSAARGRTERHGTAPDDTGRHEVAGLITKRSLVQIQPAQRGKHQVTRGVEGSAPLSFGRGPELSDTRLIPGSVLAGHSTTFSASVDGLLVQARDDNVLVEEPPNLSGGMPQRRSADLGKRHSDTGLIPAAWGLPARARETGFARQTPRGWLRARAAP